MVVSAVAEDVGSFPLVWYDEGIKDGSGCDRYLYLCLAERGEHRIPGITRNLLVVAPVQNNHLQIRSS